MGPLASPPYRSSDGAADARGDECTYRGKDGRQLTLRPDWEGGALMGKVLQGVPDALGGVLGKGAPGLDSMAHMVMKPETGGPWDKATWIPGGALFASKGATQVQVDVTGASGKESDALAIARIAVPRLAHPLDYDGAKAVALAPKPASHPAHACDLVPRAAVEAAIGPLDGTPASDTPETECTWRVHSPEGERAYAVEFVWQGGGRNYRMLTHGMAMVGGMLGSASGTSPLDSMKLPPNVQSMVGGFMKSLAGSREGWRGRRRDRGGRDRGLQDRHRPGRTVGQRGAAARHPARRRETRRVRRHDPHLRRLREGQGATRRHLHPTLAHFEDGDQMPNASTLAALAWVALACAPAHGSTNRATAPRTRVYYIAADEVPWDYDPGARDEIAGRPYADSAFFAERPPAAGEHALPEGALPGVHRQQLPDARASAAAVGSTSASWVRVIRAVVGDTIRVVFRNNGHRPFSMHPHGVFYGKSSEGAPYNDGGSGRQDRRRRAAGRDLRLPVARAASGPAPGRWTAAR